MANVKALRFSSNLWRQDRMPIAASRPQRCQRMKDQIEIKTRYDSGSTMLVSRVCCHRSSGAEACIRLLLTQRGQFLLAVLRCAFAWGGQVRVCSFCKLT